MTTVKKPLRVYADTSVFGGCFDDEFKAESVRFFDEVRQGQFVVVVSNVALDRVGTGSGPGAWRAGWLASGAGRDRQHVARV